VFAGDPLNEVRKSFTIGGKPIPPEIFADFGDAMMSDSRPIVVTVDANAAIEVPAHNDDIDVLRSKRYSWISKRNSQPCQRSAISACRAAPAAPS
jgi:hypothetical protein